jgi:hypothetical protein
MGSNNAGSARHFSETRHRAGAWNTRFANAANPLTRRLASFVSYKRREVTRLAGMLRPHALVLDLGAGNGAYSVWLCSHKPFRTVACDWSLRALSRARDRSAHIMPVCADARALPFRDGCFDAAMTIDMLGHIAQTGAVLAEMRRVTRQAAPLFIHSECADYRRRWPDRMLLSACGSDIPAALDGHTDLKQSATMIALCARLFRIRKSYSPAGSLGWLLGYPEKYRHAFRRAPRPTLYLLTSLFAYIKRAPGLGLALRIVNALANHAEAIAGRSGGGSVFIRARNGRASFDAKGSA